MKTYRDIATDGGSNVAGQVTEQQDQVKARMASVRHIVTVMSGKGGVGKSSVTVNLAAALAGQGNAVGILDADINGSTIPKMTGVRGQKLKRGTTGMIPPVSNMGLKVVSIDLLLQDDRSPVLWDAPTQRDAYTWRAMMEMGAIREFLSDTEWGALDFLFIDLPPGTDRLPNIVGLLPHISGTVVVTIPSRLSQLVVGKSIRSARELLKTPIVGLVENMGSRPCPSCGNQETLFPGGHAKHLAETEGVPYLGVIPFDTRIAEAADFEIPFMAQHAATPAGQAIQAIAGKVEAFVQRSVETETASKEPVVVAKDGGDS